MNVREDAKADGNSLKELVPVSAILVALVALFLGSEALANGTMENDGYLRILTLPPVSYTHLRAHETGRNSV